MAILCTLRGGRHEYRREPAGDLWCFQCRKRLPHDHVLMGGPPPPEWSSDMVWNMESFQAWLDEGYGYYEPQWDRRCSGCGQDNTAFPGHVL